MLTPTIRKRGCVSFKESFALAYILNLISPTKTLDLYNTKHNRSFANNPSDNYCNPTQPSEV
jgi:hypothetical protein